MDWRKERGREIRRARPVPTTASEAPPLGVAWLGLRAGASAFSSSSAGTRSSLPSAQSSARDVHSIVPERTSRTSRTSVKGASAILLWSLESGVWTGRIPQPGHEGASYELYLSLSSLSHGTSHHQGWRADSNRSALSVVRCRTLPRRDTVQGAHCNPGQPWP
ncbi:hypothetical protein BO71DRAFT_192616 [Aspergillus ellipticus CBS 707.79]|uniref:Uncharacterized protein n=1 Tax=Aspergillus ellipticus CBS 707.79 TaxID=1448320 RepID=A0A319DPD3_9EURO|nr:hypothetical protein BO71DRAFT_192616 [Aspergillus ellipticus CBS 707.79]